jgi:hypothetical protein
MEIHSDARGNLKEKSKNEEGERLGSKWTKVTLVAGITCRLPI